MDINVKVTVEAGQSLFHLIEGLLAAVSPAMALPVKVEPKPRQKKDKATPAEVTEAPTLETTEKAEPIELPESKEINYETLRAEVRSTASQAKVNGKDIKSALEKYGGRLSSVPDESLSELLKEIKLL